MNRRRTALTAAVALAATVATSTFASPATAAPTGDEFELECDELGELTVVINPGLGMWTPAFVVGSTQRLVPYAFDVTVDGFGVEVQVAKNAPRNGRTDVCEFEGGFGGVSGTVWVSSTPR